VYSLLTDPSVNYPASALATIVSTPGQSGNIPIAFGSNGPIFNSFSFNSAGVDGKWLQVNGWIAPGTLGGGAAWVTYTLDQPYNLIGWSTNQATAFPPEVSPTSPGPGLWMYLCPTNGSHPPGC
jgi:hypothetical protein